MVNMPQNPTKPNYIYSTYIYKEDSTLNNLQKLICHKTNQIKSYLIYMYKEDLALNNQRWWICQKPRPNQIIYI